MKDIMENMKSNAISRYAFIIFVIQSIFSFYKSIKLDNIDLLITGIIDNFYWFLLLYSVSVILKKERK